MAVGRFASFHLSLGKAWERRFGSLAPATSAGRIGIWSRRDYTCRQIAPLQSIMSNHRSLQRSTVKASKAASKMGSNARGSFLWRKLARSHPCLFSP